MTNVIICKSICVLEIGGTIRLGAKCGAQRELMMFEEFQVNINVLTKYLLCAAMWALPLHTSTSLCLFTYIDLQILRLCADWQVTSLTDWVNVIKGTIKWLNQVDEKDYVTHRPGSKISIFDYKNRNNDILTTEWHVVRRNKTTQNKQIKTKHNKTNTTKDKKQNKKKRKTKTKQSRTQNKTNKKRLS